MYEDITYNVLLILSLGKGTSSGFIGSCSQRKVGVVHETEEERNPGVVILTFALQYDQQQKDQLGYPGTLLACNYSCCIQWNLS